MEKDGSKKEITTQDIACLIQETNVLLVYSAEDQINHLHFSIQDESQLQESELIFTFVTRLCHSLAEYYTKHSVKKEGDKKSELKHSLEVLEIERTFMLKLQNVSYTVETVG